MREREHRVRREQAQTKKKKRKSVFYLFTLTRSQPSRSFDSPLADSDIGYGHSAAEVGQVELAADELLGYFDAVHAQTLSAVSAVTEDELERVVDANWDPPVTLGVRLVSVISDDLQHAGQAAYLRGHVERRH